MSRKKFILPSQDCQTGANKDNGGDLLENGLLVYLFFNYLGKLNGKKNANEQKKKILDSQKSVN